MSAAGVFVGRREELAALEEEERQVRGGRPRLVWLTGDPGIGKTSLLRHFVASLPAATVLWTSGDEAETGLQFGVVQQLWQELRSHAVREGSVPSDAHRRDPLEAGADLLAALNSLQSQGPVVLVIDDAQWVDGPSAAALVFLVRRLRRDPVLVVLGVRSEAGSVAAALWERALAQEHLVRTVSLSGLSSGELGELARAVTGHSLPAAATRRLHEHTGGQPLYARALLEELPFGVLLDVSTSLPAPRSLSSLVLVRLARLSPAAQQLVLAAAVLGVHAPLADVVALAEVPDPAAALDETVRAGLLVESRRGPIRGVEFPHQLLRTAVYTDLSPARRSALHGRAAQLVTGSAALSHRVAAAVGPDAQLSEDLTGAAQREMTERNWQAAAGHYLAAAEVSPTPDARAARLLQAAEAMLAGGNIAAAAQLEPAVRAAPPSARRSRVLGKVAAFTGSFEAARTHLTESLDLDGPTAGAADRGSVDTHLSLISLFEGGIGGAVRRATAGLRAGPAAATADMARFVQVLALAAQGRREESLAAAGPVAGALAGNAGAGYRTRRRALRAFASLWSDRPEPAASALAEIVTHLPAGTTLQARVLVLGSLAEAQYRLGQWDEAAAHAEHAISLAEDAGISLSAGAVHAVAARVASGRGQWDEARRSVRAAAAAAVATPWWAARAHAATSAAALATASGNHAAALAALEVFDDASVLAPVDGLGALAWRALRAEALLGLGELDRCDRELAELEARVAARPGGWSDLEAARLRAEWTARAVGRQDPARTRAAYERGVTVAGCSRAAFSLARWELAYGRYLLATGERRPAADLLRVARGRLQSLRAAPLLATCDVLLKDAGLPPPPDGDRLSLTPQELAVSKLVASGRTNAEVGAELYVTSRTVAYHLSNIYAKTGVTSRRDLARRLAGLVS